MDRFSRKNLEDYKIACAYHEENMEDVEDLSKINIKTKAMLETIKSEIDNLPLDFPTQSVIESFLCHYPGIAPEKEQKRAFNLLSNNLIGFLKIDNISCKMQFNELGGNVEKILKVGIESIELDAKEKIVNR